MCRRLTECIIVKVAEMKLCVEEANGKLKNLAELIVYYLPARVNKQNRKRPKVLGIHSKRTRYVFVQIHSQFPSTLCL